MNVAGFLVRNITFTAKNVRELPSVVRAMREYDKENPKCAYCGREGDTDVHHVNPVHLNPEWAAEKWNMIALCRKAGCHFVCGHKSNWKDRNPFVREMCKVVNP